MKKSQYQSYALFVEELSKQVTVLEQDYREAVQDHEDYTVAQLDNMLRALRHAVAIMVGELSLEELINDDIKPEEYKYANCKSAVFDHTPATFWEYLERKELTLQQLREKHCL